MNLRCIIKKNCGFHSINGKIRNFFRFQRLYKSLYLVIINFVKNQQNLVV